MSAAGSISVAVVKVEAAFSNFRHRALQSGFHMNFLFVSLAGRYRAPLVAISSEPPEPATPVSLDPVVTCVTMKTKWAKTVPSWNRLTRKGKGVLMKTVVRYSESFKLQVLRELEGGRFESLSAAMRTPEEADEKQRLRRRVRELEEALADAHLKQRFDEAYLKIACRAAGIEDVEGF